ncbi:hypothetical protein [Desulfocucumis palustris]
MTDEEIICTYGERWDILKYFLKPSNFFKPSAKVISMD